MKPDVIRQDRIMFIYKKAKTGKYTWTQLKNMAIAMGVSGSIADSYINAVYQRLVKGGYLKA